ncbi:hypothetical protein TT_C1183 [Thermus thermophilus HB27]|uniref:Uncharacterized protein n=1 Tax=Thermus thermophilus (strain ATCC BAA-163 / DSM 7039 / HB27) TaxID=262724 RepID=Q72IE9_THET2|nr:hypothetical protein TT_C1183 [Thermus thermophilus HB27]
MSGGLLLGQGRLEGPGGLEAHPGKPGELLQGGLLEGP